MSVIVCYQPDQVCFQVFEWSSVFELCAENSYVHHPYFCVAFLFSSPILWFVHLIQCDFVSLHQFQFHAHLQRKVINYLILSYTNYGYGEYSTMYVKETTTPQGWKMSALSSRRYYNMNSRFCREIC